MQRRKNNNGFNWLRRCRKHLVEPRHPRIGRVPLLCPTMAQPLVKAGFMPRTSNPPN